MILEKILYLLTLLILSDTYSSIFWGRFQNISHSYLLSDEWVTSWKARNLITIFIIETQKINMRIWIFNTSFINLVWNHFVCLNMKGSFSIRVGKYRLSANHTSFISLFLYHGRMICKKFWANLSLAGIAYDLFSIWEQANFIVQCRYIYHSWYFFCWVLTNKKLNCILSHFIFDSNFKCF